MYIFWYHYDTFSIFTSLANPSLIQTWQYDFAGSGVGLHGFRLYPDRLSTSFDRPNDIQVGPV